MYDTNLRWNTEKITSNSLPVDGNFLHPMGITGKVVVKHKKDKILFITPMGRIFDELEYNIKGSANLQDVSKLLLKRGITYVSK